ncbi:MAG: tRNA (N(6)-L-threonylcarbamoyladenosine(37)-C(2))-methylthiotransferase MtaB [Alphaproteobacteria bacterium]|nr:tRNA (N(6)-L-threonylcarbamoyladenosine(37)-C(2))-methylthiotransferase MtaB [Alphaproteobacteria bacterium]
MPTAAEAARTSDPAEVEVVTFGCRLNACESDQIAAQARAAGHRDLVVFNTCAVTREAVRQARQAIRKVRRARPGARLAATGCAVQVDPQAFAGMAELDLVFGNRDKTAPGALALEGPRLRVDDVFAPGADETVVEVARAGALAGRGGRARAYVQIQNGCDHRCTFCIIPYGRGESRSTPPAVVVDQIRAQVAAGFAEVVLTGVDLTSWGEDLEGRPTLGALARRILAEVPELPRLRLSSVDAAELDTDLLDVIGVEARLMPHLHLSIQAGDDLVLKRMKRRHGRQDILDLVAKVRERRPGVAFGADLIAGFPTESEDAFARSLALVEEADLTFLHVFPFSPRPGTPAARMPAVRSDVIEARAARLREAGERALGRRLQRRLGSTARALVEAPGRARDEDYLEISFAGDAPVGALIVGEIVAIEGRRARLGAWGRLDPDIDRPSRPAPGPLPAARLVG